MLNYLENKRVELEAQKVEPSTMYPDLERKIDEYRAMLYQERDTEIARKNMLINAQIAILDEVIEEAKKPAETVEAVDEITETEEKESEI